ncbi:amidohydrolase [Pseudoteredinibacter isoporae]|uniref:Imidazolonepropionase-like amidohydrolase n=1 Tax=Pseudoteredinibacter isoporae TaxID=570281 RepID=A0A7X0MWX3_9GAMM|nr:amidohydrolase [Pseudoteredinibacter isoporae]MBB6522675.1 imidazolonepropionase-like amidohydrolase [Pseudoteredinibacter isoporae]NHO88206.1 amidohydrolase [Pseudoteredinibacter isoporae]NIB23463.1 amidohydrolase [Pseudoteredinibacter isoporae]
MKSVNKYLRLAAALSTAFAASSTLADSVAINNVKFYGEGLEPKTSLNVLIKDGIIHEISDQALSGDTVIDGQGKVLTSGFIAVNNQLGLTEVSAVKKTADFHEDKADFAFDPSLAFNFQSSLIPFSRKGGISHAVVTGSSKGAFKGRAFTVDLSADAGSQVETDAALYFTLGGKNKGSRAKDLQDLRSKLEAAKKPAAKEGKGKPVKDDIKVLKRLLAGEFPLLARADRPADILQLLKLKKDFGFSLVLAGAAGALDVAEQLKAEKVVVIVEPMRNLPEGFDSLHQRLDTAAKLHKAGLEVILAERDTHNIQQLRFHVGNAVAHGLPHDVAVRAVTETPARVFDLGKGYLAEGSKDVVLWSGDPFELSSRVLRLWIDGEEKSTRSRQDLLRERYQQKSDRAAAYTKPSF